MKRRSMLGRRSRAIQQSPLASAFPSQSTILQRVPGTPKLPARDVTSPHPFRTPSVDGSLTDLSSRVTETWSVFKNTNLPSLKSPDNDAKRRMNFEARPGPTSRLNRLKKKEPLCELRNIGFSNTLSKKNGVNNIFGDGKSASTLFSSTRSHDLKYDKYVLNKDVKKSVEQKENINHEEQVKGKESEKERVARELHDLQEKWEHQDLRSVCPPWSKGPITLPDFNLNTPRPVPTIIVSSPQKIHPTDFSTTLGVAPLESPLIDTKSESNEEKQGNSFTELESLVEETCVNPQSLDLSSVLCNVSLGVNAIELMDKPGMNNLTKTNWGTKYKSPLVPVTEEPEPFLVEKENVPPSDDAYEGVDSPEALNETVRKIDDCSPKTQSGRIFKEFQNQLADLTSKIEAAEKKRILAEEERRLFEGERKRVFIEFHNFMNNCGTESIQLNGKRRKLAPTSTTMSSLVASKILKKDFKSPKDVGSFSRTPSQMTGASTTTFVPFTPRSLRKNLNQQFNSIFGS